MSLLVTLSSKISKVHYPTIRPQNDFYIPDEETSTSQLIGTSEERQAFFKELEDEVHRSEMADRGKFGQSEVMEKEARRRKELRLSRDARVFPEVELDDPSHMLVSVRHVSFGVVTRSFKKEGTVSAVYDWVGSVSPEPEHFSLTCAVTERTIFPDVKCEAVKRTTVYMCEEIPQFHYVRVKTRFDSLQEIRVYLTLWVVLPSLIGRQI